MYESGLTKGIEGSMGTGFRRDRRRRFFPKRIGTPLSHPTHAEALATCLHNGCDIMTDNAEMVAAAARDALSRHLIMEQDIDRAVGNSLVGRLQLGDLDDAVCPYNTEPVEVDSPAHRLINQTATREQMCLLHNNGILPLELLPNQTIAVIGPLSNENYRNWYTGQFSYATSHSRWTA